MSAVLKPLSEARRAPRPGAARRPLPAELGRELGDPTLDPPPFGLERERRRVTGGQRILDLVEPTGGDVVEQGLDLSEDGIHVRHGRDREGSPTIMDSGVRSGMGRAAHLGRRAGPRPWAVIALAAALLAPGARPGRCAPRGPPGEGPGRPARPERPDRRRRDRPPHRSAGLRAQRAARLPARLDREARPRLRGAARPRRRLQGRDRRSRGRRARRHDVARRARAEGVRRSNPVPRRPACACPRCAGLRDPARDGRRRRRRVVLRLAPSGLGLEAVLPDRGIASALGADRRSRTVRARDRRQPCTRRGAALPNRAACGRRRRRPRRARRHDARG